MKYILISILLYGSFMKLFSQDDLDYINKKQSCITIGILQGGGSLLEIDNEILLSKRFGMQVGAGFIGFGAGFNYHLEPDIRSSFFSLQYWNQGVGYLFVQNGLGLNYVYRSKKWFTFQIGLGAPIQKGPLMPEDYIQPPIMLQYSIGGYWLL